MDCPCDQFLARPRFTVDQHASIGGRHQTDLLPESFHRNAFTYYDAFGQQLLPVFPIFVSKPLGFDCVFDQNEDSFH